jgi:hypothetical protein
MFFIHVRSPAHFGAHHPWGGMQFGYLAFQIKRLDTRETE